MSGSLEVSVEVRDQAAGKIHGTESRLYSVSRLRISGKSSDHTKTSHGTMIRLEITLQGAASR